MMKVLKFIFIFIVVCVSTNVYSNKKSTSPLITAKAWIIADNEGNILESFNENEIRSIASITKLITSIVILRKELPLHEHVGVLYNRYMTRGQLLELAMVKSDNNAARMLCETYSEGYDQCIKDMNKVAQDLYMNNTTLTEPTGLYNNNVSTAIDLLKLVQYAMTYSVLVELSNVRFIELEPIFKKNKKKVVPLLSHTNRLVHLNNEFLVNKTGYIRASGGCIVMTMMTQNGWRTVILLGSKNTSSRITEAKYLAEKY